MGMGAIAFGSSLQCPRTLESLSSQIPATRASLGLVVAALQPVAEALEALLLLLIIRGVIPAGRLPESLPGLGDVCLDGGSPEHPSVHFLSDS